MRQIYDGERIHVYTASKSQHCQPLSLPNFHLPLALLRCSVNVFFGMFQLTATFTNEILTKGEIKRFSPLRSEFRNLSFLITADDISGVKEQKGDCICWQEEKKECTQGMIYLRFFFLKHWRQEMF